MNRILSASFLILFFCSCESNDAVPISEPVQAASVSGTENIKQNKSIPDSIRKSLVAATFYDRSARASSVIVYDNETATSAVIITYFENGTSKTEHLEPEKKNIFKISGTDERYRIDAKKVEYSGISGQKAFSYLYDRTDR